MRHPVLEPDHFICVFINFSFIVSAEIGVCQTKWFWTSPIDGPVWLITCKGDYGNEISHRLDCPNCQEFRNWLLPLKLFALEIYTGVCWGCAWELRWPVIGLYYHFRYELSLHLWLWEPNPFPWLPMNHILGQWPMSMSHNKFQRTNARS